MSGLVLVVTQYPDHTVRVGDTLLLADDPYVVRSIKARREAGVFVDFNRVIEFNVVELTVERFDGYDG